MSKRISFLNARSIVLNAVKEIGCENIPLSECSNRILAEDLLAKENIPPFDRSPYDGYALKAEDTINASEDNPVVLKILEEVAAGSVPSKQVANGYCTKILTGAPIPNGADTVIMYEKTVFTQEEVKIFSPLKSGDNIVRIGEDVKKGTVLAEKGDIIDPGLSGTLAGQGVSMPKVYKVPKIGLISTGSELEEADGKLAEGKIYNTNRYMLETAIKSMGFVPVYYGIAGDKTEDIANLFKKAIQECDAVVSTGGVSAGDYDLTADAMLSVGAEILFNGVDLKPGMACAYGVINGKIICALSGNPASSITNFYAVAMPALKKLSGNKNYIPKEFEVKMLQDFNKKSYGTRLLRGKLVFENGLVCMDIPQEQGNVVLSTTIGCNVMAVVPPNSGFIKAGDKLKAFLI